MALENLTLINPASITKVKISGTWESVKPGTFELQHVTIHPLRSLWDPGFKFEAFSELGAEDIVAGPLASIEAVICSPK